MSNGDLAKMKRSTPLGSRIAEVHGRSLFTGDGEPVRGGGAAAGKRCPMRARARDPRNRKPLRACSR